MTHFHLPLPLTPSFKPALFYQPLIQCFQRAQEERIIKDLPAAVLTTLTFDVATSLSQKQAAGLLDLSETLIDRAIEATWEAIRQ